MSTMNLETAKPKVELRSQNSSEIVVNNVSKVYGGGPFAKEVIKDCSFTIESNKLTVMIGPSGCGKSTLIQLIAVVFLYLV